MGQSAEKMAKENGITREAQDRLALQSHERAAAGTADGRLTAEIAPWFGGAGHGRGGDERQRHPADTSLEALASAAPGVRPQVRHRSRPATPRRSPTAPPRCCSWPKRRRAALGYEPLAYLRSYAVAAVDPGWQLLMGPAYAVPEGARARRHRLGRPRPGGDPRGVRGAGALQRPGLGLHHLGRAARAAGAGGRGGLGAHQRHGRLHRHRPSVRRHRRAAS